ncbi:MAG: thiamine pyrophosphate-binding protein, partial [Anaerolineae bacterium]|nr:thiamine pyrophosphate-binding protein [Anaerolineae bacterium]
MNGAQALVECLIRYDTKVVFGLPGDTSVSLYDALHAESKRITHLMARDERSAAFMADVYSRLSGKPGICEGPSGGGATYMLPGVVEAHGSSVALIALTTDNAIDYEAQGALTALEQSRIYESVTKWTAQIKRAEMLPRFVRRAFRLATSGRPGAVHLSLPKDVLAEEVPAEIDLHVEEACRSWPAYRTRPAADGIERAARRLLDAQRPVILAGGGAVSSAAYEELLRLAQYLGAPVATTINGKGGIAETHTQALGVVGANGGRPYAGQILQEADLVLLVGCRANYVDTDSWRSPSLAHPPTVLQIDVDPAELGNTYPIAEGLAGDAKLALADLLAALEDISAGPIERERWLSHASRLKTAWQTQMVRRASSSEHPIAPQRVIRELRALLDDEAILICDPGTPTPFVSAEYALRRPGRWVISPRAQGGLGYAIPGVVGARLAKPELPVIGLCGDGSLAMSAGDLATVARAGGPTILVLFNNGCYGWIKALQKLYHGARYLSVDFTEAIDYVQVAQGFGLRGRRVSDPEQVRPALR